MVNPRPTIACDGAYLNDSAETNTAGQKVFRSDQATVIGAMKIVWGRDDQWTQPAPSVLTFTLWEPASIGTWLAKIVAQKALRRGVVVSYPNQSADPGTRYIFQGFTTNVDVVAETRRTAAGLTEGWRVQIQCTDRSGFLGQINWYAGTLPVETMQNRAVRIRNQSAPVGIREFYFEDRFKSGNVKAVDVKDKSALDTVNDMYKSFADQWYYEPNRNVINRIPTGSAFGNYALTFGVSTGSRVVRIYPPNWADPTGQQTDLDKKQYPAAYIGAKQVTGKIALSADMIQDITDIACTWYNAPGNPPGDYTSNVNVKNQSPPARLVFESWFNDGTLIDPVIADVKRMVTGDGTRPTHPQVRWDTKTTGEIPDWQTFESLTLPAQTIRQVVLAGSPFSAATAAIGYGPVWHPCGGEVVYADGAWDVTVNLAPTSIPLGSGHVPVTPAKMRQDVALGENSTTKWYLDQSITPFDLYYINDGGLFDQN